VTTVWLPLLGVLSRALQHLHISHPWLQVSSQLALAFAVLLSLLLLALQSRATMTFRQWSIGRESRELVLPTDLSLHILTQKSHEIQVWAGESRLQSEGAIFQDSVIEI